MSISDRERFLGICRFERPGDLYIGSVFMEFWVSTLKEWVKQGAPEQIVDERFRATYFQYDDICALHEIKSGRMAEQIHIGKGTYDYGIRLILPHYEPKIIEENEHNVTLINNAGQTVRFIKNSLDRMPMFLDYPVKDRTSWKQFKKRLDPKTPERLPSDWDAYVQKVNSSSAPTRLLVGSSFGFLREWVGLERLLYMFYDDPSLIEDMMDQICYLETELISRVLRDIRVDFAWFWEDMAYKTGPLISPDMVRKFMIPRYRKVTDILSGNGIDAVFVDCDGNINNLIPLWLEVGINGFWPLEVAAGVDAVSLRKKYGKQVILTGNIDKRALAKGKRAIREEVTSKVPYLLGIGGYFPCLDHGVPPDVTWENYRYFINLLREIGGMEKLPE